MLESTLYQTMALLYPSKRYKRLSNPVLIRVLGRCSYTPGQGLTEVSRHINGPEPHEPHDGSELRTLLRNLD